MAKRSKARTAGDNARRAEGMIAPSMDALVERFGTEEACEEHMISLRWPGGFKCPRCEHGAYARVADRREYRCAGCGWQFSATSGTALAHTKVPLVKWFRAAFMVCSDARGASAQAVARECGVSDLTGQSMLRRLRTAMGFSMSLCRVGGDWVEVDGAHVACGNDGSSATRPGQGRTDAPVLVAVSASRCVARAASDSTLGTTEAFCAAHVSRRCQVRCDDNRSNGALAGGWDAARRKDARGGDSEESLPVVHHVISNLKAWLSGTFHGVSVRRLQEYCDEFGWRYCHRRGDALADLLGELARWPHVALSEIRSCRVAMEPHPSDGREPGYRHNAKLLERWRGRERRRREREAGPRADIPPELGSLLEEAFEVVELGEAA